MLLKRKPENLAKTLSSTLQVEIDPLMNKLKYTNIKKTFQAESIQCTWPLQTPATNGLLGILFLLVIRIPQYRSITSAKPHQLLLTNFKCFLSSKKLSTLWISVGCIWVQIFSQGITRKERKEKRLQWFLTKWWVALSLKGGCLIKTFLKFFSKQPHLPFVDNECIYSMDEEYKSHT